MAFAHRVLMLSLGLFAAVTEVRSNPGFATCLKDTLGTCSVFGCSQSRGPTECVGGKCLCAGDACAIGGTCFDTCEKQTPGTCRIFGCSAKRGPADCVGGQCVCKDDYCSINGVCTSVCEKRTGGSCSVMGCSSSRGQTECVHKQCLCPAGYCAEAGKCVWAGSSSAMLLEGNRTMMEESLLESSPQISDGAELAMAFMLFAAPAFVGFLAIFLARRRRPILSEPLLACDERPVDEEDEDVQA
mmetsp:Transcript_61791/g.133917  ORF Transcript_61791/g.133917 Transcript_61791/m.133917 type:complete len:243 (-) Transcript_61791:122-850(-)